MDRRFLKNTGLSGLSKINVFTALSALLLATAGLAGFLPAVLASMAAVLLGAAFLTGGNAFTSRTSELFPGEESFGEDSAGQLALDAMAGLGGTVLGLLGLLGISPTTLLPVAAILFGGVMLLSSAFLARRSQLPVTGDVSNSTFAASGINLLSGAGAIVLGILSLSGHSPIPLSLAALLTIACAQLLSAATLAHRLPRT